MNRAQRSLEDYSQQYKAENHLGAVTVNAMRAEPQPYWRGKVSENMMYHPDVVTEKSHTVCWQGVISTYVAPQVPRCAGSPSLHTTTASGREQRFCVLAL